MFGKDLLPRLRMIEPLIDELMDLSGTAGLSIGISTHHGVIYKYNAGKASIELDKKPGSDTMYFAASIAKSMTAAGIGILVHQKRLTWDTKVASILPDFQHFDPVIQSTLTIEHLLTHTSGLGGKSSFWQRDHGNIMIPRGDKFLKTFSYLPRIHEVGKVWSCSNYNYGLLDHVIEAVTGMTYGQFITDNIFIPLEMKRSTFDVDIMDREDVAEGYLFDILEKEHVRFGMPRIGDGTIMVGAMGLKSCVNDLLKYTHALMKASRQQSSSTGKSSSLNPFCYAVKLLSPHITISQADDGKIKDSYALGWVNTKLPWVMSQVSVNEGLVQQMPTIGSDLKEDVEILYHSGSAVSFLTSVTMIPRYECSIVIMSNTLGNQDCPDWISMLLVDTLLDTTKPKDFTKLALESANTWTQRWVDMARELNESRMFNNKTEIMNMQCYIGKYWNKVKTWYFDIFEESSDLWMAYCGERQCKYKLSKYKDNVLTFEIDYGESSRRGLWPIASADYYLFEFQKQKYDDAIFDTFIWKGDWEEPEGEVFSR